MPLITVAITLVIVGVALWAVNTYIPMAKPVKTILNLVVVVMTMIWLLQTFGFIEGVRGVRLR